MGVWLEFAIDYDIPLGGTNGSWTLVKNWRYGVIIQYLLDGSVWNHVDNEVAIGCQLTTFNNNDNPSLNNGKTFGFNNKYPNATSNSAGSFEPLIVLCYYPSGFGTGYWQPTPVNGGGYFKQWDISSQGNIYYLEGENQIGDTPTFKERLITGFDGDDYPEFAAATTIITYPTIVATDAVYNPRGIPVYTDSGDAIIFNGQVRADNNQYHIGFALSAIHRGGNKYLYQTAPRTYENYIGPFPLNGYWDIGNGTNNAGGIVVTCEDYVMINHHGEFWKASQTNYFFLYSKLGLPLAIFGITIPEAVAQYGRYAMPKSAGNTFAGNLVMHDGVLYAYFNDESVHSAIHRWKISALDTIGRLDVVLNPPTAKVIPGFNILENLPYRDNAFTGNSNIHFPVAPYFNNDDDYLISQTSRQSADPNFIDHSTQFRGTTTDRVYNYDLDPTGLTTSMDVIGNLNLALNTAVEALSPTAGGMYIDILDAGGKKIARTFAEYVPTTGNPTTLRCNKTTNASASNIFTATDSLFILSAWRPQPVRWHITSAGVVFSWGEYTSDLLAFEDPTCDWSTPTTLQVFYDAGPATVGRACSFQQDMYRTIV